MEPSYSGEQDVSSEASRIASDERATLKISPHLSLAATAILLGQLDFLGGFRHKYRTDNRLCQNPDCDEKLPPGKPRYCKSCRAKLGDFQE